MIRYTPLVLWITIALTSVGCSGLGGVDVGRVMTSGRDGWQHPERVIAALEIEPGARVAEIGAGRGYWLEWLSAAVGPTGRVYAVEVEPEQVARLEEYVVEHHLRNVEVILGAYDDPRLPDDGIDLALTSLSYHHIDERIDYFRRLQVDLRPAGRVAHLDDRPDAPPPISWFQHEGHWSDPETIVCEMNEAGYARLARFEFLPSQSFQIFAPRQGSLARRDSDS
jgi:predicted methyltransferase